MFLHIDLNQNSLGMFFAPYQEIIVTYAFENRVEFNSRQAMKIVNDKLKTKGLKSISRASVINFLNELVDSGTLTYREENCKGGSRRIYTAHADNCSLFKESKHEMNLTEFVNKIGQAFYEKLHELAPDAKLVPVVF